MKRSITNNNHYLVVALIIVLLSCYVRNDTNDAHNIYGVVFVSAEISPIHATTPTTTTTAVSTSSSSSSAVYPSSSSPTTKSSFHLASSSPLSSIDVVDLVLHRRRSVFNVVDVLLSRTRTDIPNNIELDATTATTGKISSSTTKIDLHGRRYHHHHRQRHRNFLALSNAVRGGSITDEESDEDNDDSVESDMEEDTEEEYDESEEVEEDEEDDDDDEQETDWAVVAKDVSEKVLDVTQTKVVPVLLEVSKKTYHIFRKYSIATYKALLRAYNAGIQDDEEDDDEDDEDSDDESSIVDVILKYATTTLKVAKRMATAALDFSEEDFEDSVDDDEDTAGDSIDTVKKDDSVVKSTTKAKAKKQKGEKNKPSADSTDDGSESPAASTEGNAENSKVEKPPKDFGTFLSDTYSVTDTREVDEKRLVIMDGPFKEALSKAHGQARLLIIFIPATNPKGKRFGLFGGDTANKVDETLLAKDKQTIQSLFSKDVAKAAARKPLKKGSKALGSFAVWSAKQGSSEANEVFKRLKISDRSSKGTKRPILCVVYPYSKGDVTSNFKIIPDLLVQHHGNPPPGPEDMAAWMNSLRKRHPKHYERLQKEVKDIEISKEIRDGVVESIVSDKKREQEEAEAAAVQKAKEEEEAARQAAIEDRRKKLKDELPDDIKGSDVKRIALRFPDGRKGERGFDPEEKISVVFNWVDALFEIEREKVILTSMNGKMTFSWDEEESNEITLEAAGIGKSTAFRVTEVVAEDEDESKLTL